MKTKLLYFVAMCALCTSTSFSQYASFSFDADAKDANKKLVAIPSESGISYVDDAARGKVAQFDGTGGFLKMDGTTVYNFDAVTINLWFNWTTPVAFQWWVRIWDFGTDTATVNHDVNFLTLFQDGKLKWHIHPKAWTNGSDTVLASIDSIKTNQWYMLTCVHAADSAKLYLNGVLQDARATGVSPKDFKGLTTCYFGKSNWPDPLFNGMLDDLKFYNSVLSASTIAGMYGPTAVASKINSNSIQIFNQKNNVAIQLNVLKKASIMVYDLRGVKVIARSIASTFTTIDNLKTGVYIVKVINGNDVTTRKIVIR